MTGGRLTDTRQRGAAAGSRPKPRWRDGLALPLRASLLILGGAVVLGLLASLALGPHGPRLRGSGGDAALVADAEARLASPGGYQSLSIAKVDGGRVSFAGLGSPDSDHPEPPGPDTRYELGSITKTFTAMLLADAVDRGEIALDDTLATWIPELAGTEAGGVTVSELAEQRSGIPRLLPSQLTSAMTGLLGTDNPYDMSTTEMISQTREVKLTKRGEHAYSNLGVSLLGEALARATDSDDWPALAQERLFEPLGMTHTTIATTRDEIPAGGVAGHRENGRLTEPWYGESSAPAGSSTWTTAGDLARYARAVLDGRAPGMTALEPRADAGKGRRIGLIWLTDPPSAGGTEVVWHNGGTGGGSTWLGLDRRAGTAVLVLGNSGRSVDALGKSLLTGEGDAGKPTPPVVPGILLLLLLGMGCWLVRLAGKADRRSTIVEVALEAAALSVLVGAMGPWQLLPGWVFGAVVGLGAGGLALAALRGRALPWSNGAPKRNTASVVLCAVVAAGISGLVLFT